MSEHRFRVRRLEETGLRPQTTTVEGSRADGAVFRLPRSGAAHGCGSVPDFDRLPPAVHVAGRVCPTVASDAYHPDPHIWRPAMSWGWRYVDADGEPVAGTATPGFDSQGDAESWLGEEWPDLRDAGAAAVFLVEDDRVHYGPMPLDPG